MIYWYEKKNTSPNLDPVIQDFLNLNQQIKNGEFWYDKIKKVRTENIRRLKLAIQQLPLPAAFDEAAKALRALIREKKNVKNDYIEYIEQLYKLACIRSFMLDYAPILKMPGYNVMLSIPGGYLFGLQIDYNKIGVEKLALLTKTDKKMIVEKWGEAEQQKTMNEVYKKYLG